MSRNTGSVWKKSRRLGFSVLETGEELTLSTQSLDNTEVLVVQN